MVCTRLCKKYICPFRFTSFKIASLISPLEYRRTSVIIGSRPGGAVVMVVISRSLFRQILRVLGIGVAVKVKTSTSVFISFNFSFCLTPNRCSSSTTTRPRSLNLISGWNSLCVPITISTSPFSIRPMISLCSF